MAVISIKDFDEDLYYHLKIAAAQNRVTLREYITQALTEASDYTPPKAKPTRS